MTGEVYQINARVIINATGFASLSHLSLVSQPSSLCVSAMSDDVKRMDRPDAPHGTVASAGVHVVFDHKFFEDGKNPFDVRSHSIILFSA